MTTKQAAPATPLPWTFSHEPRSNVGRIHGRIDPVGSTPRPNDAAYIVAACNAYPRLMAEREQLVAALKQLYAAFPDCEGGEQGKACMEARRVLNSVKGV